MLWAMVMSAGVCLFLLPILIWQGGLKLPRGKVLRYVILSALISFVLPNALLFSVIPHVGSGYAGMMFALSPVFTLGISALAGLGTPGRLGLTGVLLGLAGAVIVSLTRGTGAGAPELGWILAAVAVPLALACGNVYRSLDWPDEGRPDGLAFWSHLVAVVIFLIVMLLWEGSVPLVQLAAAPWATLAQAAVAALTFPAFFRLQQRGGPVLLSQIGYVAAAVGMLVATGLLGEQYSLETWLGAAVIAAGIARDHPGAAATEMSVSLTPCRFSSTDRHISHRGPGCRDMA